MTSRITSANVHAALENYSRALIVAGFEHDPASLRVEAPYGQVWYVLRRDEENRIQHDLPGFHGSTGSGFLSRRDLYNALHLAASVLFDLSSDQIRREFTA